MQCMSTGGGDLRVSTSWGPGAKQAGSRGELCCCGEDCGGPTARVPEGLTAPEIVVRADLALGGRGPRGGGAEAVGGPAASSDELECSPRRTREHEPRSDAP